MSDTASNDYALNNAAAVHFAAPQTMALIFFFF